MGLFSFGKDLKIHHLENDLQEARSMIKSLQADLDRVLERKGTEARADVEGCEFVIDWVNMDAFSIERMGDPKGNYTVIGYYVSEGGNQVVAEWKFYCSQAQHNALAEEFRNQIKKND